MSNQEPRSFPQQESFHSHTRKKGKPIMQGMKAIKIEKPQKNWRRKHNGQLLEEHQSSQQVQRYTSNKMTTTLDIDNNMQTINREC
ncbi:hypothetical protein H5410_006258 [Solanum commersonii]|uniref:Uncharacterized protein n=1 Tax=Solanum commersonii TaxID=4109 RepID=A0A9J6A9D7_SOLCO|nr:hypothetical protein H5410_006258 [Solanum commersonii]